ncbi:MAG TPA: urease subunit beta [Pirellulaceae bacterium]
MNEHAPGAILHGSDELELNAGRPVVQATVTNAGDRAIQVGSHFHFFEANSFLRFDREAAFGLRLDIPSGTAVRFEAGQTHVVSLVPFGGAGRILGANNLTDGASREEAVARARERGFML